MMVVDLNTKQQRCHHDSLGQNGSSVHIKVPSMRWAGMPGRKMDMNGFWNKVNACYYSLNHLDYKGHLQCIIGL